MQFDSLSDYMRAAPRHIADARELLQYPTHDGRARDAGHRHLRGAAYLAGYAVECALKAYIISRSPGCWTFTQARGCAGVNLDGSRSHNLGLLLRASGLDETIAEDPALASHWLECRKWTPDWRYHPKPLTAHGRARQLVDAAEAVWRWVEAQRRSRKEE